MTALPKHWPSSRRQGRRRAANKNKSAATMVVKCKHCGSTKLPGFVCQNCNQ